MSDVDPLAAPKQIWRYFIRDPYAVVYVDSSGLFLTFSDHGTYGYRWTHPGTKDFRRFLWEAIRDPAYMVSKLAPSRSVLDEDRTRRAIREHVCKLRRAGDLTRNEAREEWDLCHAISSDGDLVDWYHASKLVDATELIFYQREPQAIAFCERILPQLAAQLQAELEKKSA